LEIQTDTNDSSKRVDEGLGDPWLNLAQPTGPNKRRPRFLQSLDPGPVLVRVLLFVVLVVVFSATLGTLAALARLITPSGDLTNSLFYSELTKAIGTLLAAWVMSWLEGRRLGEFGLPLSSGYAKFFLTGAVFGIVEISGIIGVLAVAGYYSFGSLEVHGVNLLKWALFWAVSFVIVGFFEEYAFRGYLQFALTKGFGFWAATIVTSVIFGVVHLANPGESWPGILGVIAVGLFWCFTLKRTGTLWFAFGMHAAFDFGETFLFSVPDSGVVFTGALSSAVFHNGPVWLVGGTAGPEASVLDFAILAIFFLIVHFMYPAKPELLPASATFAAASASEFAVSIETPAASGENQRTSSDA
jgi:membrane protease YdiL (CAAX protease family)